MVQEQVVRQAWEVLEPELAEQGYELIEVEYVRDGGRHILRLYIDKEDGVTIDDCVGASRYLGTVLDKDEFLSDAYNLEVSSPGIARPIRKEEDFVRFVGETVKIKTVSPIEGRSRYTGRLCGLEDGLLSVECDGQEFAIHVQNVKKANLDR